MRNQRQREVHEWCAAAFGVEHASSVPQRAVRLLEETIEAYQAAGGDLEMAHRLLDFVFRHPVGSLNQELGGIGLTLLALAQAAGLSADDEERREFDRVLKKPLAWFHARNEAKNDAGFEVNAYPVNRGALVVKQENVDKIRAALKARTKYAACNDPDAPAATFDRVLGWSIIVVAIVLLSVVFWAAIGS